MTSIATTAFTVNNRSYHPQAKPIVVVCLDGSANDYLDAALVRNLMPHLKRLSAEAYRGTARGALPSFTNPNNASIITGAPPSVHGISGNYYYDAANDREVMMNSGSYLRAPTIPAGAANAGRKVAVITAKEKLRDMIGHGLKGIAFSAEKARFAERATHGISDVEKLVGQPTPEIYSAEASLYVFWAGAALLQANLADFLYLSTTDYIQHTYPPEAPTALAFYAALDRELGRLLELGAVVGITADHGMNSKQRHDGQPDVIFLGSILSRELGPGYRVILPITDPYVVHHGALGSYAVVHLPPDAEPARTQSLLLQVPGITEVHTRESAAKNLELPADRLGDLVVLSSRDVVLGRTPEHHDMTVLHGGLRSHGGRSETAVPFIVSEPLTPEYAAKARRDPRNFDIFDFTINGTQ